MVRDQGRHDGAVRRGRFDAPQPATGLVLRPLVLDRLGKPGLRVGVITAPAGYGKTSHAATWVACDERPTAWIDLEGRHDDALVLLTDLVAALTSVTDLGSDDLPAGGATADQYATGVAAALGRAVRACTDPFVLVLDDVHVVQGVSACDLLGALISNVPTGSTVLAVGRACHLGDLPRLRVDASLVEIGVEDLALDAPNVAKLFAELGVPASSDDAAEVAIETEGWPVGVRLAALSSLDDREGSTLQRPASSGRDPSVSAYLDAEWLWGLADDERDLLTRVSPLDWLSGDLCNEVSGRDDAGEVLHRIHHDRLLLVPLDRRGGAYRMHGLLREALQSRFERVDPDGVRRVHERASAWFERSGDIDRAVRHAVAGEDFDRVEQLVVAYAPVLYTNGEYGTLDRWVEAIPRERVLRSPALCLCAAMSALGMGRSEALPVWLRFGEHAVALDPDADPMSRLCLMDLRSTCNTGPVRPALADAEAAYRGLPPGMWHAASCIQYGAWTWAAGEDGAEEVLAEGVEEATVLGAPSLAVSCTMILAVIANADRDTARAWALVERARRMALEHGLERAPGMALLSAMHALASASTGAPEAARTSWQLARTQLAQLKEISGWANVQTRLALAHASLLLGDRTGAETMLREANEFLVRQPDAVRAHQQVAELEELTRHSRNHSLSGASSLTTAELRVLHYLPTNLSLAEIGARLFVSRYTVKTHCGAIYRKLEVSSRSEAVEVARQLGLLEAPGPV